MLLQTRFPSVTLILLAERFPEIWTVPQLFISAQSIFPWQITSPLMELSVTTFPKTSTLKYCVSWLQSWGKAMENDTFFWLAGIVFRIRCPCNCTIRITSSFRIISAPSHEPGLFSENSWSIDVPSAFAITGRREISGVFALFSHLETAWNEMPSMSASCSCVKPRAFRSALMFSPIFMSGLHSPHIDLILRHEQHNTGCRREQ